MSLLSWSHELSVGIPSIDAQHKKLINIANELHQAMLAGKSREVLHEVFDGLVDYTVEHFAYEEQLFDHHAYPQSLAHKREHKDLVGQVEAFKQRVASGDVVVGMETMKFLKEWISNHILKSDKQYSDYLLDKGVD
jgi:hemerythrin-like metal-binding protein